MPVPSAVISVPISPEPRILSRRARSTLRILPRKGRIAWKARLRPCLAEPPALSPSTRNSSAFSGSRSWQSASLPGRLATSSTPLRRVSSRALRAASRAAAASTTLATMILAGAGFSSSQRFERLADQALDDRLDLGADQLVLGLRGELGVRHLDREHAGQTLAGVLAGERHLLALGDAALLGIGLDAAGQRAAQPGEMGAAVALRDVVGEAQGGLVVAVVPLERGLDLDPLALGA